MRAGIALGTNLGERLSFLKEARSAILALSTVSGPQIASRVYETEPVASDHDAGSYLNAVMEIDFEGSPMALLDSLQGIESRLGRPSKRPRNAPRTIDLDVLYVGNLVLSNDEVVIPHPRLHLRRFVLTPLNDIRPELVLPGQQLPVAQLLAGLQDPSAVVLFADSWDV